MRRITGIALNDVGDDSTSLSRANRQYSFYMRNLLDDPRFNVYSFTKPIATQPPPAAKQPAPPPKKVVKKTNPFIVGRRGAGMYNANYIENSWVGHV